MAVSVGRLARICLNATDPEALARFFIEALGFSRLGSEARPPRALALGPTRLDILHATGRPYPGNVPGWSPLFQHCAILTADMRRAMARLKEFEDWTPISTHGPEHLPESSGGATAFKFRDPEGHPLEFLSLPESSAGPRAEAADLFLRIDHSAISVGGTERSVAFYASLGLELGARSLNIGPEQERLDGVPGAEVEVTALVLPSGAKPHVELLRYRGAFDRNVPLPQLGDVAATRLVFAVESDDALDAICNRHSDRLILHDGPSALLRDPDGHLIEIEVR
jgi:catechol 2,3-dioxygenase-like lactoylglutathione lyase family enzyme